MNKRGFTLIEVIITVVLIMILASGFFVMIKANTNNLVKGYEINRSNYEVSDLAHDFDKGELKETFQFDFVGKEEGTTNTFTSSFTLYEYRVEEGSNYMLYFGHE